jgi:hypothetical protein
MTSGFHHRSYIFGSRLRGVTAYQDTGVRPLMIVKIVVEITGQKLQRATRRQPADASIEG